MENPARRRCRILGGGGHAKVVIAALRSSGWDVEGCYDDNPSRLGLKVSGAEILGPIAEAGASGAPLIIAIGLNRVRQSLVVTLGTVDWAIALHDRTLVETDVEIGQGTLVALGAIVQAEAWVGEHVILNTGSIVEHDCQIGDFVHIAPGARLGGAVRVGEGAFIGLGAIVLPQVEIGAWATVGAGAVVTRSVAAGEVVAGVPARPLRR